MCKKFIYSIGVSQLFVNNLYARKLNAYLSTKGNCIRNKLMIKYTQSVFNTRVSQKTLFDISSE